MDLRIVKICIVVITLCSLTSSAPLDNPDVSGILEYKYEKEDDGSYSFAYGKRIEGVFTMKSFYNEDVNRSCYIESDSRSKGSIPRTLIRTRGTDNCIDYMIFKHSFSERMFTGSFYLQSLVPFKISRYETADGSKRQESGQFYADAGQTEPIYRVFGSFSYKGPDGVIYSVNYRADEYGFQPLGAHLPGRRPNKLKSISPGVLSSLLG